MPEIALAERSPLANVLGPGRHGRFDGDAGVTLRVRADLTLYALMARRGRADEVRRAAAAGGVKWPEQGRFTETDGLAVLWAGPDQWQIVAEPLARAAADRLVDACAGCCAVAEQSDARAVVMISGPQARAALAKGVGLDLHPRAFGPGASAVTPVAGVPGQIWQTDDRPSFTVAVPRSFAEGVWHWLTEASAEYGVLVEDGG